MARKIPIHYLKENSNLDAEVVHLLPRSDRWNKLGDFETHIDDCFTIILVTKGSGFTEVDFRTVTLSEGELGIIAPGQIHADVQVKDCEAWMLRMSPDMIDDDYYRLLDEYSLMGDTILLTENTRKVLCSAMELLSCFLIDMDENRQMKTVIFNMLNVILGIITPELVKRDRQSTLRSVEITAKFKRLLPQFVKSQKRPSFYAERLCISEVYLNEVVKKSTGRTPSEWISTFIILEAKRMLRSTTLTVKEIAHELGIEDHAYFSRLFKKNTDMTPLEFRRRYLK
ncbi:MAG: AraC family transcriptional regulator [Prevotellaceae bacterium]|nr:AraC family transcriptional regulator [Prevotellaceae bacterium]